MARADNKVLLVGWDAADWKVVNPLMDHGLMPSTRRLVANGVMANLATLSPALSPMMWTSIATGKRPFKHGILGFTEPTQDGTAVQPVSNLTRKTKAIWNILNQNGKRSLVIGWWPSHPAEPINGVMVSNHYQRAPRSDDPRWPMVPGTVHPPELAPRLAELRLHPFELDRAAMGRAVDASLYRARKLPGDAGGRPSRTPAQTFDLDTDSLAGNAARV